MTIRSDTVTQLIPRPERKKFPTGIDGHNQYIKAKKAWMPHRNNIIERVVEVERIVEVEKIVHVQPDPLQDVLRRAEEARANIQATQEPEPEPIKPDGPPAGFEDLAREDEAWSETEQKLLIELCTLRSRVVSNGVLPPLEEGEGARLNRLERLFRSKGSPAFEQAG